MSTNPTTTTNIKLKSTNANTGKITMIKYHVFIILLILLVLGFLIIVGKFGSNGLAFFIFIIFLLIPVIVMYRNDLPDYIPGPLRALISDTVVKSKSQKKKALQVSKVTKQIFIVVSIVLLIIGCIILLSNISPDLKMDMEKDVSLENDTFTKIMATLACAIIAGILVLKLPNI